MPASRLVNLPWWPIISTAHGMEIAVPAGLDRDEIARIRNEMPPGDSEAISWTRGRLMMISAQRKVRIGSKFQWRSQDPESLFVAMDRGIDNEVVGYLGEGLHRPPPRMKADPQRPSRLKGTLEELADHVRSLMTHEERPITSLEEWRDIDPSSYRAAKKLSITRDVCSLLSLSYRSGGRKPAERRVGGKSLRYPRQRAALKVFLKDLVRGLVSEGGKPVKSLNDWRQAHEGSYSKARTNGLQREICEELKLHVTKNITRASPRQPEDQNPA